MTLLVSRGRVPIEARCRYCSGVTMSRDESSNRPLDQQGQGEKSIQRRDFLKITAAAAAASGIPMAAFAAPPAPKKTKIDTPLVTCGASTQASISLQVCAPAGTGATGLPAGFSIQWMTLEAYNNPAPAVYNTSTGA